MGGSRVKLNSLKNAKNELIRQNKRKQMKEQILNITSKAKKCKYVVSSSCKLFKASKFLKISNNSTKNQNTFRRGYNGIFYIKIFGIYPTTDL